MINPIQQIRLRSLLGGRGSQQQAPRQMGGFRGMQFDPSEIDDGVFRGTPSSPTPIPNYDPSTPPEVDDLVYRPKQVPMQGGGFKGLFSNPTPPVTSKIEFGGNDAIQAPTVTAHGPNDRASQFYELMEKLRNRETPGLSAYREALNNVPTPEQYKPNWLTRIASGLSGFSAGMKDAGRGVETAMNLNRSSYESAMNDYSNRLGTLKEQATMEEAANRSEMDSVYRGYQMGLDADKFEQKKKLDDATINQGNIRAGAAASSAQAAVRRAEIAAEELKTKGITSTPQRDGSLQIYDSKTGQSKTIPGDSIAAFVAQSGRISSNAAASNAATNRNQFELDAEYKPKEFQLNQWDTFSRIQSRLDADKPKAPTSAAQQSSRNLALSRLQADPAWQPFFAPDATDPGKMSAAAWAKFREAIDLEIEEIEGGR